MSFDTMDILIFFFFKQKTAYEMRISDWSSDVCSSDLIEISGTAKIYASSEHGRRHFCGTCGTGLFYTNEAIFPGQIDVQSATLDDPDLIPAQAQIPTAERIGWMEKQIGRASWRERVCRYGVILVVAVSLKKKTK